MNHVKSQYFSVSVSSTTPLFSFISSVQSPTADTVDEFVNADSESLFTVALIEIKWQKYESKRETCYL